MLRRSIIPFLALAGCQHPTPAPIVAAPAEAPPASAPAPVPVPVEPCPTDLSLGVPRTIDARTPANTQPGPYAREHRHQVGTVDFVTGDDAVARIVAIERAHEEVVPSPFRAAVRSTPKDAALRLRMARCELDSPETIRRAAYDASVAFLLGAPQAEVYELVSRSMYPDGPTEQTCTGQIECGTDGSRTCDLVTKTCVTPRRTTASKASQVELDIEDILARAYAARITKQDLDDDRYRPGDLAGTFAYGRLHRCGQALCVFTRADVRGGTALIHWDIRYRGDMTSVEGPGDMTDTEKRCHDATGSISLDQCTARCQGRGDRDRATCEATCQTHCKRT